MHVYFSGIGGTAIGPLALIAKQAGFEVSGSDSQDSQYIEYLRAHGINKILIGQTEVNIRAVHTKKPIEWFVYSSAITGDNPELKFAQSHGIKSSKRDEFINLILQQKHLKMIAIAGTHGKTTTTAMAIWLFKQLEEPVSYSVGAKIDFGNMGEFDAKSEFFVYEADEFDRNFLAFEPYISVITGVSWDHHEIFLTREDYQQAFKEFITQSKWTILWQEDADYLGMEPNIDLNIQDSALIRSGKHKINLAGLYNRLDAWLAIQAVHEITNKPTDRLIEIINKFPGLQRRMEEIAPGLYSDYAHTPEKIRGAMSVALETFNHKRDRLNLSHNSQSVQDVKGSTYHANAGVVVVYEPLHNRRQHYMIDDYKDCFEGAKKVYWIPSYLAREDPGQRIIAPAEMISHLNDPKIAVAMERDNELEKVIRHHLDKGDMVVGMAGGGGGSLDEWLRERFQK